MNRTRSLAAPRRHARDAASPPEVPWSALALALLFLAGATSFAFLAPRSALDPLERALAPDTTPRVEP